MGAVVPGPMSVMRWIETEVGKTIKRGEEYVEWTTPSGFVVRQRYFKKKVERIQLQLLGRCDLIRRSRRWEGGRHQQAQGCYCT